MSNRDDDPEGERLPPLAELIEQQVDPRRLQELQLEVQLVEQWQFQSPILPPAILKQYADLIPDFPERYFANWERQTTHRQHLETTVVTAQSKSQLRAQPYAFALGALVLLVALVLGLTGHDGAAVAVVGLDFLGLGGVFVYGRHSNVQEARRKAAAVPDPVDPRSGSLPPGKSSPKGRPTPTQAKRRKKKGRR